MSDIWDDCCDFCVRVDETKHETDPAGPVRGCGVDYRKYLPCRNRLPEKNPGQSEYPA